MQAREEAAYEVLEPQQRLVTRVAEQQKAVGVGGRVAGARGLRIDAVSRL